MPLIDIQAKDIRLGDILGEGMRVWLIVMDYVNKELYIRWAPDDACLLSGKYRDAAHTIHYKTNDIVRVIRS